MTAGTHETTSGGKQSYPQSPLSMSMENMEPKKRKKRTSGQKILLFVSILAAVVFGFVLMAANSNRTIQERQAEEKNRKPLMSDPSMLQNDLLAEAEALKYRSSNPQERPLAANSQIPNSRVVVVRPPTETRGMTQPRLREPRPRERMLLTDEEREAARKYRDMRFNALVSKSEIDGFQSMKENDRRQAQENPLSSEQLLNALAGMDEESGSSASIALMQETQNAQDVNAYRHKLDFLTQNGAERTPQGYSTSTRNAPLAQMELKAGSVIPGLLITGINSDLPGTVVGQVSENVWDTATGRFLLIPQGTRILGAYDSRITQGQKRVSVVWNRLIYPDGSSLNIAGSPGTDIGGYSGIKGRVNNHYGQLLNAVLFSSVFSALADIAAGDTSDNDKKSAKDVLVETTGVTIANVGSRLAERALDIQPTLVIKPGSRFNVMVQQDVVFLQPWRTSANH
jgi:type IV secretion system protein VirB10